MSESLAVAIPAPLAVAGISQELYDKQEVFRKQLEENLPQIAAVLPPGVRAHALATASMTAALDTPKLLECSPLSMMRSVIKMASLGLRIGETCDLIPVKTRDGMKVECWVRVKGVVELAINSRAIRRAREGYVCQGDVFEHEERADGVHFLHRAVNSPLPDASNVIAVYAVVILNDGTRDITVWKRDRLDAHKKRHAKQTGPGSVWAEHPLPMMAKTVVKDALRFTPLSPAIREALSAGDEVDGTFEVVADPEQQLLAASTAMEKLNQLEAGTSAAPSEPTSLEIYNRAAAVTVGAGENKQTLGSLEVDRLKQLVAHYEQNGKAQMLQAVRIVLAWKQAHQVEALNDAADDFFNQANGADHDDHN